MCALSGGKPLLVFLTYLTFANNWIRGVDSHTLGLHRLSSANPTGDPVLPEVEGPFEVEIKVRINDDATNAFHTIFEWNDASQDNMVWFGQVTLDNAASHAGTVIRVNGAETNCTGPNPLPVDAGHLITYKFGVDGSGDTRIFQDGSLVVECLNRPIPLHVPRTHRLGTGLFVSTNGIERLTGAILGLRLTNLNSVPPQDPGSRFAFMNFPSKTFASGFVASFYARWDNLDAAVQSQQAFDFGNGEADNNIVCGQFQIATE